MLIYTLVHNDTNLSEFLEAVGVKCDQLKEEAKGVIQKSGDELQKLAEKAPEAVSALKGKAEKLLDDLGDEFEGTFEKIKKTAGDVKGKILRKMKD